MRALALQRCSKGESAQLLSGTVTCCHHKHREGPTLRVDLMYNMKGTPQVFPWITHSTHYCRGQQMAHLMYYKYHGLIWHII